MKLLVGTLYTIENEFEDCCASIQSQNYRDFEHIVLRDLSKQEAHEALYGHFMEKAEEYDLLVKVDADMVIPDRDLFGKIVDRFESDPELDLLLIAVHDFPADRLVTGLNVFRNSVRWALGSEALFTDRTYLANTVRKKVKDTTGSAPAAIHCANPSPFQAYHYGFHRGMKAVFGGDRWGVLAALTNHYRHNRDVRLAYAILGADAAFTHDFAVQHISYNDDTLLKHFETRYEGVPDEQVHRAVSRSKVFWLFRFSIIRRLARRYYQVRSGRSRGQSQTNLNPPAQVTGSGVGQLQR
jgi:hypothetical protein